MTRTPIWSVTSSSGSTYIGWPVSSLRVALAAKDATDLVRPVTES